MFNDDMYHHKPNNLKGRPVHWWEGALGVYTPARWVEAPLAWGQTLVLMNECGDIGGRVNVAMHTEVCTFEVQAVFSASFLLTNWIFFTTCSEHCDFSLLVCMRSILLFLSTYHNLIMGIYDCNNNSKNNHNSNNIIVILSLLSHCSYSHSCLCCL